jgi:hypothetical protein
MTIQFEPDMFPTNPAATAAAHRALEAAPSLEPDQYIDETVQTSMPVLDHSPGVGTDSSNYGTFRLEEPIAGLAFGGFLPPGAMLLLAPGAQRSQLVAMASQHFLGRDLATLATVGPSQPRSQSAQSNLPYGSMLLRAGEAVKFGRLVTGMAGVFFNIWANTIQSATLPGILPVTYPATTGLGSGSTNVERLINDLGVFGPTFRPYLRLFEDDAAIPMRVDYTRVPHVVSFVPISPAAGGSEAQSNTSTVADIFAARNPLSTVGGYAYALIPPGTKHVTMAFAATMDGIPTLVPGTSAPKITAITNPAIGGASFTGPTDVRVYWLMADGLLHNNAGDNWTASARGQLSATNDFQIYDVPNNAVAVYPYVASPSVFTGSVNGGFPWVTIICTED